MPCRCIRFLTSFFVFNQAATSLAQTVAPINYVPWLTTPVVVDDAIAPRLTEPISTAAIGIGSNDFAAAQHCMTTAIYYEAAFEPTAGQEAVAQVILNRVQHDSFPKSVCGVIYQGSTRRTGCQFSFTCDGALARPPRQGPWNRAQDVARRALMGEINSPVGNALNYHAYYVSPYWSTSLQPEGRIGAHLFYSRRGPKAPLTPLSVVYLGNEVARPLSVRQPTAAARVHPEKERYKKRPEEAVFSGWGIQIAAVSVKNGRLSIK